METKNVNWTEAETTDLVTRYQAGETVDALANMLGRSTRSVVAKLARERVYVAKVKQTTARVTKANYIALLAQRLELDPQVLESLAKAEKSALVALLAAVE